MSTRPSGASTAAAVQAFLAIRAYHVVTVAAIMVMVQEQFDNLHHGDAAGTHEQEENVLLDLGPMRSSTRSSPGETGRWQLFTAA
ncbi:unnamed protein product [Sphagnum tenellum]